MIDGLLTNKLLSRWHDALSRYLRAMHGTAPAKRGAGYAVAGYVLEISHLDADTLECHVAGSGRRVYEQFLKLNRGSIEGICACPVSLDCKHCCASALRMLAELQLEGVSGEEDASSLLPVEWKKLAAANLPPLEGEGYDTLQVSLAAAGPHRQAPAKREKQNAWWQRFLAASTEEEANTALAAGFRERLPRLFSSYFSYPAPRFSRTENRVDALLQHDMVAQQAARYYGMRPNPQDPALTAWLKSPAAAALREEDEERASREKLMAWLQSKAPSMQARSGEIAVRWLIRDEDKSTLPELCFQILLTTQKVSASPRNWQGIETLLREHRSGKRTLPISQAKLLAWIDTRHGLSRRSHSSTEFPMHLVREWMFQVEKDTGFSWEHGGPVELDLRPARLTIGIIDGIPQWGIRLPGDDSTSLALLESAEVISDGVRQIDPKAQPELFILLDGVLHPFDTGGMPPELVQSLQRRPALQLDHLHDTSEAAHLLDLYLPYADEATGRALVAETPVQCWVEFRKEARNAVHMTVRALSEGGLEYALTGDFRWRQVEGTAPARMEDEAQIPAEEALEEAGDAAAADKEPRPFALVERPRKQDTAHLEAWLAALPGGSTAAPGTLPLPTLRWTMPPDGLYDFLEWWLKRPPGLACYADNAFRQMLQARQAPRYKVSVQPSGKNWLQVSVDLEEEVQGLSLDEAARLLESSRGELILMRGGGYYRRKDLEEYREQAELLADLGLALENGEQRVHALQVAGAAGERLAKTEVTEGDWLALRQQMLATLQDFSGVPSAALSIELDEVLRPYQKTGVDFLAWACQTFGGAVLADDMGLGKTVQVLAALSNLRGKSGKPSLVVCPASVAHNWQREAARFTPTLRTVVLEAGTARHEVLEHLEEYDLIIKNYSLARRDAERLQAVDWLLVCVDEAQAIKNPAAAITTTVKSLTAEYRVALTGTPIENRLQDLWSIADFAVPGYLPPLEKINALDRGNSPELAYRALRARLRPVLLRRLKAEVAPELPPRIEERLDCAMTTKQKKAYLAELKQARALLESSGNVVGKERIQILAALTRLRQLCCEPELRGVRDAGSGKVDVLMEQVPEVLEAGHKVLVFSQFVQMIKILERRFGKAGIPYYTLTGATKKRPELIAAFEADERPCVFFISLKAGGTGLNLTSASHVFLFDPWWNPAVEAQAIDRTHRIGQDKTVLAFRLVTEGTIEERILELQEEKRGLVKNVLEDEAFNRMLTKDDFLFLLE